MNSAVLGNSLTETSSAFGFDSVPFCDMELELAATFAPVPEVELEFVIGFTFELLANELEFEKGKIYCYYGLICAWT